MSLGDITLDAPVVSVAVILAPRGRAARGSVTHIIVLELSVDTPRHAT